MTYTIQRARATDLAAVCTFELAYIREIEPDAEARWKDALPRHIAQWTQNLPRMFIAFYAGQPVGHCFWQVDGARAVLASLYVLPEHRRRGVATRLLQRYEADAARHGSTHLTLGVYENNPARALYERAEYCWAQTDSSYHYFEKPL